MDFSLSTEQKEIYEMVTKFVKNEIIPVAAKYDEESIFPTEQFKKAWELGLVNTCIPVEYGGAGFTTLDSVIIGERLAYGCMGMNSSFMVRSYSFSWLRRLHCRILLPTHRFSFARGGWNVLKRLRMRGK